MTKNTHTQDRLDIHLDSNTPVIDAFSQYPLLDGSKKYTVEVTSFACPMDIPLLPSSDFWEDDAGNTLNYIFQAYFSKIQRFSKIKLILYEGRGAC